jgi:hypothetical protein
MILYLSNELYLFTLLAEFLFSSKEVYGLIEFVENELYNSNNNLNG